VTRWTPAYSTLRGSLKRERWPEADQLAWSHAHRKVHSPFRKDGGGPTRSPYTVSKAEWSYGRFLTYLTNTCPSLLDVPPCERLGKEVLGSYFDHLHELGHADDTVVDSFDGLRRAMTWMFPGKNFKFVTHPDGVSLTACLTMACRPKFAPHTTVLMDCARQLFEAAPVCRKAWRRAMIKDAVAMGLLATMALRIGALSQLQLGRHVRFVDGEWIVEQTPDITKTGRRTKRSLIMPVEPEVGTWLTRYVDVERVEMAQKSPQPNAFLFLNKWGEPMRRQSMSGTIARRTRDALGKAVYPQTFRISFATSEALDGSDNPLDATTILGHTDPKMTLAHYNRATGIAASRRHTQRLKAMRKSLSEECRHA
jgi:site-specific recombinase XerC